MSRRFASLVAFLTLVATPALAHPGHGLAGMGQASAFTAGFLHPFTGLDHLLAMTAVGLWAGLVQPARSWAAWPAAFLAFMLAGFAIGVGGAAMPAVEGLIIASVIGLGLAVALRLKLPTLVGAAVIAVFALAHGYAHGQELPAGATALDFAAGFALATLCLHLMGLGLALAVRRARVETLARATGLGVAASGVALIWLG